MEIRQFKYFVKIADLGSFSRASRALHIAQPALSQQMAQLEAELGQALLLREPRGVRLTGPGEAFYRHAQRLLRQVDDTASAVQQCAAQPSGTVCVGLPLSTAAQYALPLLAAVRERHPGIVIEFFDEISGNLLHGLNSGRLDIGVLVNDDDARLVPGVALMDELLFMVSRAGMAPARKSVSLRQLHALPLALPGPGQGVRPILDQALARQGLRLGPLAVCANSMSIMRHALYEGMAHGVMPWGAVADDVQAGRLVATRITPALTRRVHVCTTTDAGLSQAGQVVHDLLLEVTRQRVRGRLWRGVKLL
ncbi:MAG: LysR substrate-binding domain-containing protein [Ramlibacter sp.]